MRRLRLRHHLFVAATLFLVALIFSASLDIVAPSLVRAKEKEDKAPCTPCSPPTCYNFSDKDCEKEWNDYYKCLEKYTKCMEKNRPSPWK